MEDCVWGPQERGHFNGRLLEVEETDMWVCGGKNTTGRVRAIRCKIPEAWTCLVCSGNSEATAVAGPRVGGEIKSQVDSATRRVWVLF